MRRIVLAGESDLAEIAALCAMEREIEIVGLVQDGAAKRHFMGMPVFADFDAVTKPFDCVLVTSVTNAHAINDAAIARFGAERVLVPELLGLRPKQSNEAAE